MLSLPSFNNLEIESFPTVLKTQLNKNREKIKTLLQTPEHSWETLMAPLDEMDDALSQLWSPISHMHSVVNNESLRQAYKICVSELSKYGTEIGQNKALYDAIKKLPKGDDIQNKIIEDELLGFRLSGVALSGEKKSRFKEIQARLSDLSTEFENHLLDATGYWKKKIEDESLLQGLPEHAKKTAREKGAGDAWVLGLDFPCFHAVMTYADNEALREEMYHAYVTRASELSPEDGRFDNSTIMDEILALRHEKARLLDFNNYAELSLATKMAPSTDKVVSFLLELCDKALNQAKKEYAELEAFAGKSLNPWDIGYYSEKQQTRDYAISQETLRPYFPENKLLNGMFEVAGRLYGITLRERKEIDRWHKDVRFFEIYNKDDEITGGLYIDLYAREHKRGGAWMDDCVPYRRLNSGELQLPVAYLTCNFTPPPEGREACFSHDEVITLFHEFGHCLHHLMTNIPYLSASGINGVEWDAVELPSQFFENWCWQKEALSLISAHVDTGVPLPEDLFQKLNAARHFQSAMGMMRQLEFSLFDFLIHLNYNVETPTPILDVLSGIRKKYAVAPVSKNNRFPHGFSHIFAGGYGAGYYSYKWAEVLSSDAFSRFEEEGIFNRETGELFLNEILSRGSSRKALASFIAFRGREPSVAALLQHNGIQC
jgi:oligopeptidase A